MKKFIGVDPGKAGAIVILDGTEVIKHKFPKIGNEYDVQAMIELFRQFQNIDCHLVLEDVKALQGPMKAGNWSLSRGKTILEMCCIFFNIPFTMVHSKTWQKEIWQGIEVIKVPTAKKDKDGGITYKTDTKGTTLLAIKRLFPKENLRKSLRSDKDDDGLVDALGMAEYCRRRFK